MEDNISINTNTFDDNDNKLYEMEWSEEHENILIDWADKAMCYRWLHSHANMKYSKLTKWFTIPVIIISTLTGTANFAQDRVPLSFVSTFVMLVGTMNILAGIISTIGQFLKINELNESHRVSSISWDKFYRNIKIELAKNPKERIPVGQMIKFSKEEFDRLMETSPMIQNDIIKLFNNTFKNVSNFTKIRKPEICDDLVSTDTFRFVVKNISTDERNKFKIIAMKAKDIKNKMKLIEQFYNEFINVQGRPPTQDEVLDSVKDKYKEFQNISSNNLSFIIEKVFIEKNIHH
jgi:hypothetical protein